ncbi:protein kinase [Gordonia sp. ABSL1-1]|uniref:protein kinase domain-containing protein n=1 Tax=Gordonia sp. ABSL1-1 TaxID=3053923 RepID=UPI002573F29F|nr:protein kinase [Gordonia sp. ABSL1-1]MDL9937819.1 protein kinase [Gordonia sp. ABSL1-1]
MALNPGTEIAGYRVISRLGQGGMGEVYLVENPTLEREEAMKVISVAGVSDPGFQQRFTNEARTTAKLSHPGIITIHQHGIADGLPWFTMTYLRGKDLTNERLTPAEVAKVISDVADALDYAHRHQVIHRDIKPANILVLRDETNGDIERTVVLDFGIAKLVDSASLTGTHAFIGTLAYSAPEVIDGGDATARSDQYALACTAYALLTGQAPFPGTTPSAILMAHVRNQITPVAQFRPDLTAVDPALQRALARNPAERYTDCRAFAAALSQVLTGPAAGPVAPTTITPPRPMPYPNAPYSSTPGPHASGPHASGPHASGPHPSGPNPTGAASGAFTGQPNHGAPTGHLPPTGAPGYAPVGPTPSQPQFAVGAPHSTGPQNHPGSTYPTGPGGMGGPSQPSGRKTGKIVAAIAAVVVVVAALVGGTFLVKSMSSDGGSDSVAATPTPLSNQARTSCAVRDGQAYCWGRNNDGQVGDGSTDNEVTTPRQANGPTNVVSISTGLYLGTGSSSESHGTTCAVGGGSAWCWGDNSRGQVGDGGGTTTIKAPHQITELTDVTGISTGGGSTCAIAGGDLYCWGDNAEGQLGVSGSTVSTPTKVPGLEQVSMVTTNFGTTCAIADASLYCWGGNAQGQIGDGSTSARTEPTKIEGLGDVTFVAIGGYQKSSVSYTTTCAIASGKGYCWGDNQYGQIGDDSTTTRDTPTEVGGLENPTVISTGYGSSCAVAGGSVYCWGDNDKGQLGTGESSATRPTTVSGISAATFVTTGLGTTCAQAAEGTYCWGSNSYGQIGDGTEIDRPAPERVGF